MMSRSVLGLALFTAFVGQGCGTDHSEEIATLQKQVASLTRQVEETHQQTDAAQEGQQKLRELVSNLEVEVSRLKPRAAAPPAMSSQPGKEQLVTPSATSPVPQNTAKISCPQVWKLLGQGRDERAIAQLLGTSEAAVRACEQEIGRKRARK